MPQNPGFLNANLVRAYPFVVNLTADIPDWLIVDFRAEILSGQWDPSVHRVYLAWVSKNGNTLRFGFRTDCPDLADEELVFERNLTDPRYRTTFADSTPLLETLQERCGCGTNVVCNPTFTMDETCQQLVCNADFSGGAECVEHICNPNFALEPE